LNTGGDTAFYGTWEEARMESEEEKQRTKSKKEAFFSKYQVLKIVLSVVLVMFAVTRFSYYESLSTRMDLVFLSLVLSAFLLWMLPWADLWERLSGVNIGGFGFSLEAPHVKAALGVTINDAKWQENIGQSSSEEEIKSNLIQRLKRLEEEIPIVRGSRILWVDDNPHTILGERRLLRALGIDIMPARSSKEAQDILEKDNDFDLIITDVWRTGGYEGVDFIVSLRKEENVHIRSLPVIFYAAYPWDTLVARTRPARELQPEAEVSNSADDLIPKVIRRLAEERTTRTTAIDRKKPTSLLIDRGD
jgi:CheY-like chemotaxis protein